MMRRILISLVNGYRLTLGAWLRPSCRFYPSCSGYAIEALQRHGAIAGSYLTVYRIVRCGPWCAGGDDAVPEIFAPTLRFPPRGPAAPKGGLASPPAKPRLFTHLLPPSQKNNT